MAYIITTKTGSAPFNGKLVVVGEEGDIVTLRVDG